MARAAVLRGRGTAFEIEGIAVGEPRPHEVLVRVVAVGVCHTDLLVRDGVLPPPVPVVLGHEGSGVVAAVGDAVTGLAVGDRVVLSPSSCGRCANCRGGHPMNCATWGPLNLRGRRPDGSTAYRDAAGQELNGHFFGQSSFAEHVVVHERNVVPVGDRDVPLDLLGPLGCGVQTGAGAVLEVLRPSAGSSLLVLGAGAVGLSAVMAARVAGCTTVVVSDPNEERLALAEHLGATHVHPAPDDLATRVVAATGGGVDAAVDAVGLPATTRTALDAVRAGGTAVVAGSAGAGREVAVNMTQLMTRTLRGVIEGDCVPALLIPRLLDLHLAGRFPFDELVRRYAFDEINKAVEDSEAGRTVKPVLVF
nr:NAD(P)-dependent alcohol dehydrogenase [Saccharothrix syringae]